MLTYKDILDTITKKLSENFEEDIYVDSSKQGFDKSCFFVSIIPVNSISKNKKLVQRTLIVEIKYFTEIEGKSQLYDIAENLEEIFRLNIKVKDRTLTLKNSETDVLEDEVGKYLSLLLTLDYFDSRKIENNYDLMGSLEINMNEREGN